MFWSPPTPGGDLESLGITFFSVKDNVSKLPHTYLFSELMYD